MEEAAVTWRAWLVASRTPGSAEWDRVEREGKIKELRCGWWRRGFVHIKPGPVYRFRAVAWYPTAGRVAAARWAQEHLESEVFILDDGFQYLRMARDLNIVVIDATNPWGGGKLLPRGRLRESSGELNRADCIVITRADPAIPNQDLENRVRQLAGGRPIIRSWAKLKQTAPLQNDAEQTSVLDSTLGQTVGAFCGIGNPQSFFNDLARAGYSLCYSRAFPDHHWYRQTEIDQMVDEARKQNASALLTTTKDAVKLRSLRFDVPCFVVGIDLKFDDETRLRDMLHEAIATKPLS